MKKFFKLKWIIIIADILIIPGMLLCHWLTNLMLSTNSTCTMLELGGKCIACGGTHFVNTFTSGKFIEAFNHNQYLFFLSVFFAITIILLNLYILFGLKFAKAILRRMYSIPSLIIWLSLLIIFFIIRNIPIYVSVYETISLCLEKISFN